MQPSAATVEQYLASLPEERRSALAAVRAEILRHLPDGYVEAIGWGMITYSIPLARFPNTYNGQPLAIAALGSQKNYMAVHLMNLYGSPKILAWFVAEFKKAGKKLDMGKACVRFKNLADLPVGLIGQTVAKTPADELIDWHEKIHAPRRAKKPSPRKPSPRKAAARKPARKK